jgi:hypothetical protein
MPIRPAGRCALQHAFSFAIARRFVNVTAVMRRDYLRASRTLGVTIARRGQPCEARFDNGERKASNGPDVTTALETS